MQPARKAWPIELGGGEVVAFPSRAFGRRAEARRFSLVVDLASEEIGARWWRGVATLAALCASALLLAPEMDWRFAAKAAPVQLRNAELSALAAPDAFPAAAPVGPDGMPKPQPVQEGEQDGLLRVSGGVTDGLYWSLRGAGATPDLAADYLQALATRIDVGEVSPFDRFEFVIDRESQSILYVGLHRAHGGDVQLMKWAPAGRPGWFDGNAGQQSASGLMAPVAGRITSRFGSRVHPILRFSRFHSGIDFGAGWGSPIVAAADGLVVGAGWHGGYGRQVQVAHGSGIVTSYSHMSSIAAAPGTSVRQGQVIGYVGSSGLSTGPHLHFEVRVGGRAVDPLTARLVQRPAMDGAQLAAFRARMKRLLAIPMRPRSGEAKLEMTLKQGAGGTTLAADLQNGSPVM